jgi:hypothetical protein
MRKIIPREGPIEYYHIYPISETAENSILIKLQNMKLESLTKIQSGELISLECLNKVCGVKIENEKVVVNPGYVITKILSNRAFRKYKSFKEDGAPNWLGDQLFKNCLEEMTM